MAQLLDSIGAGVACSGDQRLVRPRGQVRKTSFGQGGDGGATGLHGQLSQEQKFFVTEFRADVFELMHLDLTLDDAAENAADFVGVHGGPHWVDLSTVSGRVIDSKRWRIHRSARGNWTASCAVVTPREAEQAIANDPMIVGAQDHPSEERFLCFGRTNAGRFLTILYTERRGRIRVVTAYRMTRAQQRVYLTGRW